MAGGSNINSLNQSHFLKLNGTAGMIQQLNPEEDERYSFSNNYKLGYTLEDIDKCLQEIEKILSRRATSFETLLHFAWENNKEIQLARDRAQEVLKETRELVIIGYSFPLYNRRVDREIFKNLPPGAKVYIQVAEKDLELVEERFRTVAKNKPVISLRKDLNQFFIPESVL